MSLNEMPTNLSISVAVVIIVAFLDHSGIPEMTSQWVAPDL